LWTLLFAVETGRRWTAIAAAILAMSVREDVACCVGVLGFWLLLRGPRARAGAALAVAGVGYFLAMKLGVMPRFADGTETFVEAYAGLLPPGEHTFVGVLKTIAANPPFVANVLLDRDKLVYALQILAPLLLLPLGRPLSALLLVPGCLFTLMSTGCAPLIRISFQYSAYWIPFVFVALVVELERAAEPRHPGDEGGVARRRSLAAGVTAASLACSYLYGAIVPHEALRCGFAKPHFVATPEELRAREHLAALAARIPADAKVAASEHLLPHVSGRRVAYTLRNGVEDADSILFAVPMRLDEADKVVPLLRDGTFGVVDDQGDMTLTRRGAPTGRNVALLERMGVDPSAR
ncbi:MAG TPA: DUF2079 domain-containing protein, partial [Polyangiaceae bacterium]|nr:DUF2079 domain-containing protein [Polyangiaceae bacterium]